MQEKEFDIRRFSKTNFGDFHWLFVNVFGVKKTLNELKRKYDTAETGVEYIGYIAYDSGKPVAYYGVLPHYFTYQGKTELVAHSIDSVTLPEYQRAGVFRQLATMTYALAEEHGIRLIWGFGTEKSGPAVRKYLNFELANEMIGFQWDGTDLPFRKYRNKLGGVFSETRRSKKILQPWMIDGPFTSSLNDAEGPLVKRDESYMTHKSRGGSFFIEIDGAQFWVKAYNGIWIGDMHAPNEEVLENALKKLVSLAKEKRLGNVIFQSSPDTFPARVAAKSANKVFPSWHLVYRNLNSDFPLEKLKATLADIDTF